MTCKNVAGKTCKKIKYENGPNNDSNYLCIEIKTNSENLRIKWKQRNVEVYLFYL